MSNGQPDACKDEPDDVANQSQHTGSDVVRLCQILATNGLFAEWQKGKLTNDKTGFRLWNANDGDSSHQTSEPPPKAHQAATEYEPQDIANDTHLNSSLCRLQFGYLALDLDKQAKFTIAQVRKMMSAPKTCPVSTEIDALKLVEMAHHHQGQVPKKQLHHHKT